MVGLIVELVVVVSAFWVYYDATANRIGKVAGVKGMFNMPAGGWAAVTLGLWIVGFPSYLLKRASLIQIAKVTPVEAKNRTVGFVVLAVVAVPWLAFNLVFS